MAHTAVAPSAPAAGTEPLHVIHIPKTGGTALAATLAAAGPASVTVHDHSFRLRDLPAGARAAFFVREPLSRYVSGFECRQRKSRPRYHDEWSRIEAWAFGRYADANALAEDLYAANPWRRWTARAAIRGITHTGLRLRFWLGTPAELARDRDRIAFIGHQPDLALDLATLARRLGLPALPVSADPVVAHVAPAPAVALGPLARANLERWYAEDIVLYRQCLEIRAALG